MQKARKIALLWLSINAFATLKKRIKRRQVFWEFKLLNCEDTKSQTDLQTLCEYRSVSSS
ncbi:CLUMA_CG015709, isoform A [Clunio marinus]|uniref:CLUMA_CG015709, isoform A n=1 Tax=Clunio marinus TaxID=568069 RepID=A0A1J1IRV3_9DIPT|nr:CLUMA_CG015709, isoform A [Clunio marinus]